MATCESGGAKEDYNLPLHVGALFIILGVSAGACGLPVAALKIKRLKIPAQVLFIFRHFGTGVLLATAFVHLFPTAFVNLNDPCLPAFFNDKYPAFAGAVALASVCIIASAEMALSPGKSLCSGAPVGNESQHLEASTAGHLRQRDPSTGDVTPTDNGLNFGRTRSGRRHNKMTMPMQEVPTGDAADGNVAPDAAQDTRGRQPSAGILYSLNEDEAEEQYKKEAADQERKKLTLQCMLLECGILFHSVFIGMALAVATGANQVILLIAISFHQMFEGLALGSRIAAVGWNARSLQPWLMALAYGCTTPLGQAIGIATRNLYSPDSQVGLIVVGTMNAISAGLLTFTSLVDLLYEDFLSEESWRILRGRQRIFACSLVLSGMMGMALIGAWA